MECTKAATSSAESSEHQAVAVGVGARAGSRSAATSLLQARPCAREVLKRRTREQVSPAPARLGHVIYVAALIRDLFKHNPGYFTISHGESPTPSSLSCNIMQTKSINGVIEPAAFSFLITPTDSDTVPPVTLYQITHSVAPQLEGRQVLRESARLCETLTSPFNSERQAERDVLQAWGKLQAWFTSHCLVRVTSQTGKLRLCSQCVFMSCCMLPNTEHCKRIICSVHKCTGMHQ